MQQQFSTLPHLSLLCLAPSNLDLHSKQPKHRNYQLYRRSPESPQTFLESITSTRRVSTTKLRFKLVDNLRQVRSSPQLPRDKGIIHITKDIIKILYTCCHDLTVNYNLPSSASRRSPLSTVSIAIDNGSHWTTKIDKIISKLWSQDLVCRSNCDSPRCISIPHTVSASDILITEDPPVVTSARQKH